MGEFCNNLKITLLTFSSHYVQNLYKSDNQVVVVAICRYKTSKKYYPVDHPL